MNTELMEALTNSGEGEKHQQGRHDGRHLKIR